MGQRSMIRRWAVPVAIGLVVGIVATGAVWALRDSDPSRPPAPNPPPSTAPRPGDRTGYHLRSPVEVVPGTRGRAVTRSTVAMPANWDAIGGITEVLGFDEGTPTCRYRVMVLSRVRLGDEPDAASQGASVVPGEGRYVLDQGQRRSAAWRVVRIPTKLPHVKVRAIRVAPLRSMSEQLGRTVWLETIATATSHLGDECHSGTYRDTLARGLGDAMATARVDAYLQP